MIAKHREANKRSEFQRPSAAMVESWTHGCLIIGDS